MSRPVAMITGGRRGIGRATARMLAERGFDLAVVDIDDDAAGAAPADLASAGGRAMFVAADIADLAGHEALVDRVIGEYGRIDCLVSNAGIGSVLRGDLLALTPANFDRVLAVNLRGTVFLTHAVARRMLQHPPTHARRTIVTVTSVSAELVSPERIDYCVSKAGLAMWVRGLALRLAADGIAVFDVRPGIIRTDMTAGVAAQYDARIAEGLVPAKRWGEADDVARAVAALASGDLAFATGTVINVDGGLAIPRL